MGFNFNFFGENEHRVFNYKPRYFDPEAEERKKLFGKVDGLSDQDRKSARRSGSSTGTQVQETAGENAKVQGSATQQASGQQDKGSEYTPGQYIKGSFRDGNYQKLKKTSGNRMQKIIGAVGLVLVFVILYFFAKFYGLAAQ